MSRRNNIVDRCHLCGELRKLTFEHIPPRAAFNNNTILYNDILTMVKKENLTPFNGKQMQGGIGRYSLCAKCNSFTGHEYGTSYVKWAAQGMEIVLRTRSSPLIEMPFHILPLHVIKQIVSMFLSVNPVSWRDGNLELVDFVLSKKKKFLDPKYSIYAFYSVSAMQRQSGTIVKAMVGESLQRIGAMHAFSEITFPPFGYVMTVATTKSEICLPPDKRLRDITHFANYSYRQYRPIYLKLPVLPIYSFLPGDYRTEEEVSRAIESNKEYERLAEGDKN